MHSDAGTPAAEAALRKRFAYTSSGTSSESHITATFRLLPGRASNSSASIRSNVETNGTEFPVALFRVSMSKSPNSARHGSASTTSFEDGFRPDPSRSYGVMCTTVSKAQSMLITASRRRPRVSETRILAAEELSSAMQTKDSPAKSGRPSGECAPLTLSRSS